MLATPERPGVYLMKDPRGTVLYVGKASVLRNRLRSYFGSTANLPNKIRRMLGHLHDFEYIVTDSPAEALILENTLIKKFKPNLQIAGYIKGLQEHVDKNIVDMIIDVAAVPPAGGRKAYGEAFLRYPEKVGAWELEEFAEIIHDVGMQIAASEDKVRMYEPNWNACVARIASSPAFVPRCRPRKPTGKLAPFVAWSLV